MKYAAFIALSVLAGCSSSAPPIPAPPITLTASWDAPIAYTNGTPLKGPVTYRIYAGACGAEKVIGITMGLTFQFPQGATGCAFVTAVDQNGLESAPSMRVQLGQVI